MKRSIRVPACLAATLSLAAPAFAERPVTTSLQVPLAGNVSVPLMDGSFETVALTGQVHVVTHVTPPDPILPQDPMRIQVNLDQVTGVGEVSTLLYVATGSNRVNLPESPPDPIMPLDIDLILTFNDLGALTSVTIESIAVPVP